MTGISGPLEPSLPREAYWDPGFFARERRSIFRGQWSYVGREEMLAGPGAYRVLDFAGESIILLRGEDGRLHAHLNLCRHRGSRLLCGAGTLRGAIRCPYHAWAYEQDGSLVASPFVPSEAIPPEAKSLHSVAIDTWGGFIFIRIDHTGPAATLRSQLEGVPQRLQRYPLADLRIARSLTYEVRANWKVLLENYNECYHCAGVHPELCRIVPAFKQKGGSALDWERGIPHREGAFTFTASGTTNRAPFPGLDDDERVRHKGELIYPNFMLSLAAEHVAAFALFPLAPDRTIVVCDFLFHPAEMAKAGFDPSDTTEFWDLVNKQDWSICESVQAGMSSLAFDHGYYAPMEDSSLDIRRYIAARLGDDAVAIRRPQ